jgi:V-type H+-transporting ATPase subunit D
VSNKKQRDQAAADAEIREMREKEKQQNGGKSAEENGDEGGGDILGEQGDEDVIF